MVVFFRLVGAGLVLAVVVYLAVLSHFVQRPAAGAVELLAAVRASVDWLAVLVLFGLAAAAFGFAEIARRVGDVRDSVDLVLKRIPAPPPPPSLGGTSPTGRRWDEPPP